MLHVLVVFSRSLDGSKDLRASSSRLVFNPCLDCNSSAFILDAAYQAAEHTLLDQRLLMVSGSQYQAPLEMLDRPESDNTGLADLLRLCGRSPYKQGAAYKAMS